MRTKIEYHTETKEVRDTVCPIDSSMYNRNKDFNDCKKCPFFSDGYCVGHEYEVKFRQESETDDDEYGGMPSTDYRWFFPCSKCGEVVKYWSGCSNISNYTAIMCKECNTLHVLVKGGYSDGTFIVPELK